MLDIVAIIAPVFLVVAAGFTAARGGLFREASVDGLLAFTMRFAVPCLLFRAVARLDLGAAFEPGLLLSFYAGAFACFGLGVLGARLLFARPAVDAVVIGFGAMFSNCLVLGVPITERAFGTDALDANFAIISIHTPLTYLAGIIAMEAARTRGGSLPTLLAQAGRAMFRNALMIGLAVGFLVNLTGLPIPDPVWQGVDLMADAAIPAALFGMGGILVRCELKRAFGEATMMLGLSLLVHPAIVFGLGTGPADLPPDFLRSAVVTAAMPVGINAFVFAQIYGRATGAAASAVMLATLTSVLTTPVWLILLRMAVP